MDIIKALEDFSAVARHRSFSVAATYRFVTQSALSRRIQGLEGWLGVELIDRQQTPVDLTAKGRVFRDELIPMLDELHRACATLRRDLQEPDILSIHARHSLSIDVLPRWLDSLRAGFGELNARIVGVNLHAGIQSLAESRCQLLACYAHPELPSALTGENSDHLVLGHDRLVPVCAAGADGTPMFPLNTSATVPHLAYTSDTFLARATEFLLASATTRPHLARACESSMAEVLKRMALQGAGVAWLPSESARQEIASHQLVIAGHAAWQLPLEIRLYRNLRTRHAVLDGLWTHLRPGREPVAGRLSRLRRGPAGPG